MPTSSIRSPKCASSPRNGSPNTTKSGHTTRWEACRQRTTASDCSPRKLQFRTVYETGKLTTCNQRQPPPKGSFKWLLPLRYPGL